MRPKTLTILLCALLLACAACTRAGNSANATQPPAEAQKAQGAAAPTPPPSATCRLLSAADLRESQGEEPADVQGSEHLTGGLTMSQCFYRLPTFNKSINLEVIRAAPGSAPGAVKEFWRGRFHPDAVRERELKRERKEARAREREEELKRERESGQVREGGRRPKKDKEAEDAPPQRVSGVGDEAYWAGNPINSALSVLRKDTIIRISVGGPEDPPAKIKKASALARKVLKQL